jgi:hypothetical protein
MKYKVESMRFTNTRTSVFLDENVLHDVLTYDVIFKMFLKFELIFFPLRMKTYYKNMK